MDESKLIPRLAADMNIIALLDNEPNDVGGMSAEALKAKHDEAGIILKDYINNTLLPAFAGEYGAENVGITTIGGLTGATNTQKALERIVELMQEMTQGAVADGSITAAKLAPKAVAGENIEDGAVGTEQIAAKAVTGEKIAEKTITAAKLADAIITAVKIANKAVGTAQIADGAITNPLLGAKAVGAANMDDLSVPTRALQASSVDASKIKDGVVSSAKLAANSVSTDFTANIGTDWNGTEAPFSIDVTVNGVLEDDKPLIDLNPSATFAAAEQQIEAWGYVYRAVTAANEITFYATDKPEVVIPIKIKAVRK